MLSLLAIAFLAGAAMAQPVSPCSCGANPPGRPEVRTQAPYANAPDDLRPFSRFTKPYYEHYTKTVEYNGPGRDVPVPDLKDITEVPVAFLGPIQDHRDQALGRMMLNGATMAIDEVNAAGGYGGKPFKLMVHNDSAIWGASSNEIVKMTYDEKVWGMLGSIDPNTTHIALRVSLKSELPIVNVIATDPTLPETTIPWLLTGIQDDREQGYTLARRIFTELGLKHVALFRVNESYGRFGNGKFKDAARRLGHPLALEQRFEPGDTDFHHQLRVIQDSNVDAIVLWADQVIAGNILKQMREMGMKQRVFGAFRVYGDEMLRIAGPAAEGLEFVYPYDPSRDDPVWLDFNARFQKRFEKAPDTFASLGYDGMRILLASICRAGLNRARIRDVFYGMERYSGVTGEMIFDPNAKNVAPLYLGVVKGGKAVFQRYTMEKPYASVRDNRSGYEGPPLADAVGTPVIILFGPGADQLAPKLSREGLRVAGVASEQNWGKSSTALVDLIYRPDTIGMIALDRDSAHLAGQIAAKAMLPLIALSSDRTLTGANVPWIFRLDADTQPANAVRRFADAIGQLGPNRALVRNFFAANLMDPWRTN